MTIFRKLVSLVPLLALVVACSAPAPERDPGEVSRLAASLRALSPAVSPEEAARAADIAINYPMQLRRDYGVTDPPIIHNIKVNAGTRPRGLCWHWADDMEARLAQEDFRTLELHRAIANADSAFILSHSTVIMSARGDDMDEGIILDPWRYAGTLYWSSVPDDTDYAWVARHKVFGLDPDQPIKMRGRAARAPVTADPA